eukprot:TRINITY_DN13547_c0_g1_i1.p1 TRINITY_DN13547_c0_g1~~TRINITY_DN13547_c0_g1_i1.p1  ORF type:complete len:232 (-),score=29.93 TRINITY_DN13547_c0_g1_i1:39-734(-)
MKNAILGLFISLFIVSSLSITIEPLKCLKFEQNIILNGTDFEDTIRCTLFSQLDLNKNSINLGTHFVSEDVVNLFLPLNATLYSNDNYTIGCSNDGDTWSNSIKATITPYIASASNLTFSYQIVVKGNGFMDEHLTECNYKFWEGTTNRDIEIKSATEAICSVKTLAQVDSKFYIYIDNDGCVSNDSYTITYKAPFILYLIIAACIIFLIIIIVVIVILKKRSRKSTYHQF